MLLPAEPQGNAYQLIVEVDPNHAYAESNDNNTGTVDIPANICG